MGDLAGQAGWVLAVVVFFAGVTSAVLVITGRWTRYPALVRLMGWLPRSRDGGNRRP